MMADRVAGLLFPFYFEPLSVLSFNPYLIQGYSY
jgi:hypothetical protein